MVKTASGQWLKAHFSHFNEEGFICVFMKGMTSWTTDAVSVFGVWCLPEEMKGE